MTFFGNKVLMVSAVSIVTLCASGAFAEGKGLGRDGASGQSVSAEKGGQPDHAGGGRAGGGDGGGPGSPAGSGNSEPGDNPSGTAGNQGNDKNRGNAGGGKGHDDDDDDHNDDDSDDDTPRVTSNDGSARSLVCAMGQMVVDVVPALQGSDFTDRFVIVRSGELVAFVDVSSMRHGSVYGAWKVESSVDADTVCVDDVKIMLPEPAPQMPKSTIVFEGNVTLGGS